MCILVYVLKYIQFSPDLSPPFITPNSHIAIISLGTDFSLYNNPFIAPNSHTAIRHWFFSTKSLLSPDNSAKQGNYAGMNRLILYWWQWSMQIDDFLNKHWPQALGTCNYQVYECPLFDKKNIVNRCQSFNLPFHVFTLMINSGQNGNVHH